MPYREIIWTVPSDDVFGCLIMHMDGKREVKEIEPKQSWKLIVELEENSDIIEIVMLGRDEYGEHKRKLSRKQSGGIKLF